MLTDATIERWLREDVGHHDVTNHVPGETTGCLVAKENGVAAGLDAAVAVFEYLGVDAEQSVAEGDRIAAGDTVLTVEGSAREVLRGERVAVNVAGHASGIATKTSEAVDAAREAVGTASGRASGETASSEAVDAAREAAGSGVTEASDGESGGAANRDDVRIAGTRKTTPGLRGIEKRAVVAGGGDTHRLDLSHMVMVKDNHVAEMGMEGAVEHFRERVSFATNIEVEVEDPADAPRAAAAGADIVLLDNMTPAETSEAVDALRADHPDVLAEASGGITVTDVPDYARTGVDVISMGSLTHSADALDYSFRTSE